MDKILKRARKSLLSFLVCFVVLIGTTAAYGYDEEFIIEPTGYHPDESHIEIELGHTTNLFATYLSGDYVWSCDDPSIISFEEASWSQKDYNHKIRAIKGGTTTVHVTHEKGQTASIMITVLADPLCVNDSAAPEIYVAVGDDVELEATQGSRSAFYCGIDFQIADETIIERDLYSGEDTLRINGLKPGTTTVTATNEFGEAVVCTVHVYKAVTGIKLKNTYYNTMYLGSGKSLKVDYTLNPSDSTEPVSITSSNKCVKISESGVITPAKAGEAKITVKALYSDVSEYFYVNVLKPYINKKSHKLYRGETVQLKMTGGKNVKWTTGNKSIATVSSTGKVTAKKSGTVKITANAGGYKSTATIKVVNPTLSKASQKLYAGKNFKLKVKGAVGKIKWTSSNKKIASVNGAGKVTTKKAGTAYISAKVSGVTLKCKVTVKPPILNKTKKMLVQKDSFKLKVTGNVGKVKWSSSNNDVVKVSKDGRITATYKTGTATITAKVDGKKLKCKVTVKKNQHVNSVSTNVFDYDYGSPSVPLKKAYYEDGKLKIDVYVMNNRMFTADYFDWITYKLYDIEGRLIASQKFYDVPIGIGDYSWRKITLTYKSSAVKRHVDMRDFVTYDYDFYYTYTY